MPRKKGPLPQMAAREVQSQNHIQTIVHQEDSPYPLGIFPKFQSQIEDLSALQARPSNMEGDLAPSDPHCGPGKSFLARIASSVMR